MIFSLFIARHCEERILSGAALFAAESKDSDEAISRSISEIASPLRGSQ
jgi:hypothetical protein